MDISYRIPGTTEPEITVRRSTIGNLAVLVNGVPAKRKRTRSLSYDIPMSDGTITELQLKGQWTGLKAVANGVETPLEHPLPRYVAVLTFLPLLLVLVGGLIGALFGIGGSAINARLARQSMRLPTKVLSMLGVTALTVALFFGTVIALTLAISPIPVLETGTCVNGISEGSAVTADTTRSVDCALPHDNEVVGSVSYAGEGGYPGQDALQAFGQGPCLQAFRSYVGVDFQSSSLAMFIVSPGDVTWAKGDRQIACVVLAGDGSQLTGTVKGSAQ